MIHAYVSMTHPPASAFRSVCVQGKIDPNALEQLCGQDGQLVRGDGGASKMYDIIPGNVVGAAAAAS